MEFLSDEQAAGFGRFAGPPSREQLERYFVLDDTDRGLVAKRRGDHNRLGFALQLSTARFLGTFLAEPVEVPWVVVEFLGSQLGVADLSCVKGYAARLPTQHEHAREIREVCGYRDFADADEELRAWLAARVWSTSEGPSVTFDRATAWLVEHKVLLPGASVLARAVTSVREASAARLWQALAARASRAGTAGLERMLEVEAGTRVSTLERLRRAPTRLSSPAMVAALERLVEIRGLGISDVDLSELPAGRVNELARYGMAAKAQTISRLSAERRAATLLAVAKHLETVANDDALDLFDGLAAQLIARSAKAGDRERLSQLPRLAEASAQLALAMGVLLEADEDLTLQQLWAAIESHVPRSELEAAARTVEDLAHEVDPDDALRSQLVERYFTARRFLPLLAEVVGFEATAGGRPALEALGSLSKLWGRKKVSPSELVAAVVSAPWRRLVLADPDQVDRRAYTLCVTEALHRGLRRRDVFCPASSRWADPTACLLDGERWEAMRPELLEGLSLDTDPSRHLEALAAKLDQAYRAVAAGVAGNALLSLDDGGRPHLSPDEAMPTSPSLVELRKTVAAMLPRVDLPELLLEVDAWTGFTSGFTHVGSGQARMADLSVSVIAVLVAEACNVGLVPVTNPAVAALTRQRLSHVDQNYVRGETISAANALLVDHQIGIELAQAWGGGHLASADGLRFVVPVRTINAGPNSRYFGRGRGVTWLNYLSDQVAGFAEVLVPGTVRDSLFVLDGLLDNDTAVRPEQVTTDTASYSDQVFALFHLLGYQFSPRLADLTDQRFWRLDRAADYGALNEVSRNQVNASLISSHWEDILRLAGSLATRAVRASDILRVTQGAGRPSALGRALGEYGRIPKTFHLLTWLDDPSYRRRVGGQLSLQESRHRLARKIFYGHRGELRQAYREGQEDQLGALGLVLNAVVLWNTRYMDAALRQLRASGQPVADEDVVRLSPLGDRHLNVLGHYSFAPPTDGPVLRPLRDPTSGEDEDE